MAEDSVLTSLIHLQSQAVRRHYARVYTSKSQADHDNRSYKHLSDLHMLS